MTAQEKIELAEARKDIQYMKDDLQEVKDDVKQIKELLQQDRDSHKDFVTWRVLQWIVLALTSIFGVVIAYINGRH